MTLLWHRRAVHDSMPNYDSLMHCTWNQLICIQNRCVGCVCKLGAKTIPTSYLNQPRGC